MRRSREYAIWTGMISRCHNTHVRCYDRYGGRGIEVCERWRSDFSAFLTDMGRAPSGCSIERIDNDGGYEPSNCRWATATEQANNKRNNVRHRGKTLTEWSVDIGVSVGSMCRRVKSWGWERAVTAPVKGRSCTKN